MERMPAETVRWRRSAKTVLSVGAWLGGVEAWYVGGQTRVRRGEVCIHRAPMMVLTWALKLCGRDVGVGRWARMVDA